MTRFQFSSRVLLLKISAMHVHRSAKTRTSRHFRPTDLGLVHGKSTECGEIGTFWYWKSLSNQSGPGLEINEGEGCRYRLHVDGLGNRRCSRLKVEYEGTGLLCIYAGLMQVSCHVLCRANANNRHLGVLSWPTIFWRHVSVEHNCIKLCCHPDFEAVNCIYPVK